MERILNMVDGILLVVDSVRSYVKHTGNLYPSDCVIHVQRDMTGFSTLALGDKMECTHLATADWAALNANDSRREMFLSGCECSSHSRRIHFLQLTERRT